MLLKLMACKSKATPRPELTSLATLLGRFFQIRDDYMNLNSIEVELK